MTVADYKLKGRWASSKRVDGKRVITLAACTWHNMKRRCNSLDNPTYTNCAISDEFMDFQSFADWLVVQIGYNCGYHLDKDLLSDGNKIYCREYCVLIPRELNNFMCEMGARRGKYPLGVSKFRGKFIASIRTDNKSTYLGSYMSPDIAHKAYLSAKQAHASELACRFTGVVDPRVVEKLLRYVPKSVA
jgi:hypothetical protein